jgi:hypothetical protein
MGNTEHEGGPETFMGQRGIKFAVYFYGGLRILILPSRLRKLRQSLPFNPQSNPLRPPRGPNRHTLIELQARFIPIETTPLEPLPSNLQHFLRQSLQQRRAVALLAVCRLDEQVFEVDARDACPSAEVVEVEGHAGDCAVGVGDEECACVALAERCGGVGVGVGEGTGEGSGYC